MEATASSSSSASNNNDVRIRHLFPAMPWLIIDSSSLSASNAGLITSKSKAKGHQNEEEDEDKDGKEEDNDDDCDYDDDEVSSILVAMPMGPTCCRKALKRDSVTSFVEEEDNRAEGGAETPPCIGLLPDRHSLIGCVSKASSTTNCPHFARSRASESTLKKDVDHLISDSAQAVWTDGKHDLYLNLMEANFVRNMYDHGYCYLDLCGKQPQQHIESAEESLQSHENNSTSSDIQSFLNRGHSNWMNITASRVDKEACAQNDLHLIRESSLDVKKKRGYASNCEERPQKMPKPTSKSSFQSSFSDQVVPCPCANGVERIGSNRDSQYGQGLIDPSNNLSN